MTQTTIDIDDLSQKILQILGEIKEATGSNYIPVEKDWYWEVSPLEVFDLNKEPSLGIASMQDNLDMTEIVDDENVVAHPLYLTKLSFLLYYLGSEGFLFRAKPAEKVESDAGPDPGGK